MILLLSIRPHALFALYERMLRIECALRSSTKSVSLQRVPWDYYKCRFHPGRGPGARPARARANHGQGTVGPVLSMGPEATIEVCHCSLPLFLTIGVSGELRPSLRFEM